MLENQFQQVHDRIRSAALASGRSAEDVQLVAVTKKFSSELLRQAFALGQRVFAENYVQEAIAKQNELSEYDIEWHLIGHLQTNKIKVAVNRFELIHSVDQQKTVTEISCRAESQQRILIEVNLADEKSKNGCSVKDLPAMLEHSQLLGNIVVDGLMFMPPFDLNVNEQKKFFNQAAELRASMQPYLSKPHSLRELSMGTSHDFEMAIHAGATIVRLGSILFGDRSN